MKRFVNPVCCVLFYALQLLAWGLVWPACLCFQRTRAKTGMLRQPRNQTFSPNSPGFNPNTAGRGQSWPCQLLRQIPDKILIYRIFNKFTYSCINVFWIFWNLWHDIKKWRFDIHFDVFLWEIRSRSALCRPPASIRVYCYGRPPKHQRRVAGPWSTVWRRRQSTFQSVSDISRFIRY